MSKELSKTFKFFKTKRIVFEISFASSSNCSSSISRIRFLMFTSIFFLPIVNRNGLLKIFNRTLDVRWNETIYFLHQKKFKMTLVSSEISIDCLVLNRKSCQFKRSELPAIIKTGVRHISV